VVAEDARRVHLQEPPALPEIRGEAGIADNGLRALRMRDHRDQPGTLDPLPKGLSKPQGAAEGQLHENGREVAEPIAPQVVVEECGSRRELEAEPEVEAEGRCRAGELDVRRAHPFLSVLGERQTGPDVRCGIEDARAPLARCPAKGEPLLQALCAVVTGRDHVGMDVPEHVRDATRRRAYSARR
jgi:hypothetical protein